MPSSQNREFLRPLTTRPVKRLQAVSRKSMIAFSRVMLCLCIFLTLPGCNRYMPGAAACNICGDMIPATEPHHALTLSYEKQTDQSIEIQEEDELARFCNSCADDHDLEKELKVYKVDYGAFVSLDRFDQIGDDLCFECGAQLGEDSYFSLIHYKQKHLPTNEIEVLDARALLQLCPDCRAGYDFNMPGMLPDE